MNTNRNNKKAFALLILSFIVTTTFFQNCSLSKLSAGTTTSLNGGSSDSFSSYAPQSMAGAQNVINGNVILKEYRHKNTNRYFYTSRVNDQASIESTYANLFDVTGNTITIRAQQEAGLSPVYRLFNKVGFHIYTAEINDRNTLFFDANIKDEGIEGYAIKINPGASCPASTYPVNRLFHSSQSKYRLVSDTTLNAQLVAQGFVDQGILFCATVVSNTAPVVVSLNCDLNGTPVNHGTSITAYQSASVPNGSVCVSEQRTCRNTVLSGSYVNNRCTVQQPVGGTDNCATTPVSVEINASQSYQRVATGDYQYAGKPAITYAYNPNMLVAGGTFIIKLNVTAADSTLGRNPAAFNFGDIGPTRAFRSVTISKSKCDFTSASQWISPNPFIWTDTLGLNSASATFSINDNSGAGTIKLDTGVWYINIKNSSGGDVVADWSN